MKLFKRTLSLVLIIATVLLSSCSKKEEAETFHGAIFPVSVFSDVVVEDAFLYTGTFPEDGSFTEKENVLALKVKNCSDKDLQLLRIYVTTDQKELFFEITTLPANMTVVVYEKSGQTLAEDEKITAFRGEDRVDFEEPVSLQRETFEITVHDKVLNVRNITENDIDSTFSVYYKKKDADGNYFGGITFRSRIDGLKAGELKQIPAAHFDLSDSEVIFVDYAGE